MKTARPLAILLAGLIASAFLFALTPGSTLAAPGDTGATGIWNWKVQADNTLAITGCMAPTGDLVLPDSLDCGALGTLTVTRIEDNAFYDCSGLAGITLPGTLRSIGEGAFMICDSLESVTIPANVTSIGAYAFLGTGINSLVLPDSVTSVGDYAFQSCHNLSSVTLPSNPAFTSISAVLFGDCPALKSILIPANVTSIGMGAFTYSGLESIVIPDSVVSIGRAAFDRCTSLEQVTMPENPGFTIIESSAFFGTAELRNIAIPANVVSIGGYAFAGSGLTALSLPASVRSIGEKAFDSCEGLETISLNDGLESIGPQAFRWSGLMSIAVPDSVTDIGNWAFADCRQLESVKLPDNTEFTTIPYAALSGCTALKSIEIPDSVSSVATVALAGCTSLASVTLPDNPGFTTIPHGMFSGCTALASILLPDSVNTIGEYAFASTGFTGFTIPAGITTIGNYAFEGCLNLDSIAVAEGNPNFASVDGMLCNSGRTELVCYPAGRSGMASIPDGVAVIRWGAFSGCSKLTGVTIPATVADIGHLAFQNCTGMTRAIILADDAVFGFSVFEGAGIASDGIYAREGSTAQAYAAENGLPFHKLLELVVSPASGEIYTGGRIMVTPNIEGGEWSFEASYLSREGNSFEGLKAGSTGVTYTAGLQSATVDVVIREAELPATGQDFTPALLLLAAAVCAGGAAVVLALRMKAKTNRAG